jgi:hypothetical protein
MRAALLSAPMNSLSLSPESLDSPQRPILSQRQVQVATAPPALYPVLHHLSYDAIKCHLSDWMVAVLSLTVQSCNMARAIMFFLVRIIEVMFFCGIAGCSVTIVLSWYSIFRDELMPPVPVPAANVHPIS